MKIFLSLLVTLLIAFPAAAQSIENISEHRKVSVSGRTFFELKAGQVFEGLVSGGEGKKLVFEVVRLGPSTGKQKGATPLEIRVGKGRKRVVPNRPPLMKDRPVVNDANTIASYPVRYRVQVPKGQSTASFFVKLRKPKRNERVGIVVKFGKEKADSELASLAPLKPKKKKRNKKRRRRRKKVASAKTTKKSAPKDTDKVVQEEARATEPASMPASQPAKSEDSVVAVAPPKVEVEEPIAYGDIRVKVADTTGKSFRLVEVSVMLNGQPLVEESKEKIEKDAVVFEGKVPAGGYVVQASLTWEGEGGFFFSYLNEYAFVADGLSDITLSENESYDLVIEGYESGGIFTDMLDKPAAKVRIEKR